MISKIKKLLSRIFKKRRKKGNKKVATVLNQSCEYAYIEDVIKNETKVVIILKNGFPLYGIIKQHDNVSMNVIVENKAPKFNDYLIYKSNISTISPWDGIDTRPGGSSKPVSKPNRRETSKQDNIPVKENGEKDLSALFTIHGE